MVAKNGLGETLALLIFLGFELGNGWARQGVQGHLDVFVVANLVKFDMGHFFVINNCGVMCRHVTGQFGEVRGHGYKYIMLLCLFV